ncbi:MAG: hypothetical protein ACYDEF_01950 [Methanosarcina sp.]
MRTVFIINGKEQRRAGDILHDLKQPVTMNDVVNFSWVVCGKSAGRGVVGDT